ncbi:YciI family protein [Actinosynnema sp. CS-041913]|uniref:YciI family protein n=1 Tax=Actinosynnema sp. CS-041913 TaxID=3239917 RepID=UPI003D8A2C31
MKFLIQIYHNQEALSSWESMTDEEREAGLQQYAAFYDELTKSGELVMTEMLADPSQAKTVTAKDGKVTTADGPFAEAKEHLAGIFLVDCADMDRAVEIAGKIPEAASGLVDVRPTGEG